MSYVPKKQPTVNILDITPKLATELLDINTINRKKVPANLGFLVTQIKEDKFLFNGESIIVSTDGKLLDGQHRLMAVEQANKSIKAILVEGIEPEVMPTIDTGSTRTSKDVLSINGYTDSSILGAMSKLILERFQTRRRRIKNITVKLSNQDILDDVNNNIEEYQEIIKYIKIASSGMPMVISVARAGAYLFLYKKINKSKARSFIRELFTGIQETDSNMAIMAKRKLDQLRFNGSRIKNDVEFSTLNKAFTAYIKGGSRSQFRVKGTMNFDFIP